MALHRDVGAARGQCGGHDDRKAWPGVQQKGQGGQPIHDGHFDVEHDDIDVMELQRIECRLSVGGACNDADHRIGLQDARNGAADDEAVIADQNACRLSGRDWRGGGGDHGGGAARIGGDEPSPPNPPSIMEPRANR